MSVGRVARAESTVMVKPSGDRLTKGDEGESVATMLHTTEGSD